MKNPQFNAIVERMYQSISNMITISLKENPPKSYEDIILTLVHRKYMAAQYTVRATVHTILQHTPAELAFGREMIIDWSKMMQYKQTKNSPNQ